ncbi:MAG: Kynureninase (L-kynurenine hydrolase) [Heterodermia speciosa]|uniref:Kynureninase n=1 Tax=Heterodermia speciosa TaxID=116794 RepID=A0A8H3F8L7_9LECA|nr:MAG: Kynureninase (L-kynurenine hydrolase) [Heterodermia speciosa]
MDKSGREHAQALDFEDPLKDIREQFIIPTKTDLLGKQAIDASKEDSSRPCIYFCGNSLGLQPQRTAQRVKEHLEAWATKGVTGHFVQYGPNLPPFLHVDDVAAQKMAPIVGALPSEVALMETLTANIHLMLASFYRPTEDRYRIMIEGKAFPSDHYAVESHLKHHGQRPEKAMVLIEPKDPDSAILDTTHIFNMIDAYAATTALILLPGVQYYTGQYLGIQAITAYAHSRGILIGWDLAHAVGNVDLHLHDWDVDFALWCNYKYLNSGPGSIAGLFVHENHGHVNLETASCGEDGYRPRLSGWWGADRSTRFQMGNKFVPIPGAAGFQLGNPSALALTTVLASLEVFSLTSMTAIRRKSIALTGYLADLLLQSRNHQSPDNVYSIITPLDAAQRGAQLSVKLKPGLLDKVLKVLEEEAIVVDERKPDVIRIAPAPLYNTFAEVWDFVQVFEAACRDAHAGTVQGTDSAALAGQDAKGWNTIK